MMPPELFRDTAPAVSEGADRQLGDWHGHPLLLDRRQCVLFCHDLTSYVLFLLGLRAAQFSDLGRWHLELFLATLTALIRPSFVTHPGFVMVSTRRIEEWNDEND